MLFDRKLGCLRNKIHSNVRLFMSWLAAWNDIDLNSVIGYLLKALICVNRSKRELDL
jgi:hypothetical protein